MPSKMKCSPARGCTSYAATLLRREKIENEISKEDQALRPSRAWQTRSSGQRRDKHSDKCRRSSLLPGPYCISRAKNA